MRVFPPLPDLITKMGKNSKSRPRILYGALRHDPTNPDLSSGVDYNFYSAFVNNGFEVSVVGPFRESNQLPDRVFRKVFRSILKSRYLKWGIELTLSSALAFRKAAREQQPDLLFTMFPPLFMFLNEEIPCMFNTDLCFRSWQRYGAGFGRIPLWIHNIQERKAVKCSTRTVVFSQWAKDELAAAHRIAPERIVVVPMPSALPLDKIPRELPDLSTRLENDRVRLLLVGRDYHRKGIDIALNIHARLKERNIDCSLTICGPRDHETLDGVSFEGPFRKSVPSELNKYISLYQNADFLIHPARFDPSPIVPAEAAAFAVPTLTNNVGGVGTSVANGSTGIVHQAGSGPEVYVESIVGLVKNRERYRALCVGARRRFEDCQNWEAAGKRIGCLAREILSLRS